MEGSQDAGPQIEIQLKRPQHSYKSSATSVKHKFPFNSSYAYGEICKIRHVNNPQKKQYIGFLCRVIEYNPKPSPRITYKVEIIETNEQWVMSEENLSKHIAIKKGIVCKIQQANRHPVLNGKHCEILEYMGNDKNGNRWRVLLLDTKEDWELPQYTLQPTNIKPPPRKPIKSRKSANKHNIQLQKKKPNPSSSSCCIVL